jgi:hypothetical protein
VRLGTNDFCVTRYDDQAMSQTTETSLYATAIHGGFAVVPFDVHYTNIRVLEGCETDAQAATEKCKALDFDPLRDRALWDEIAATFVPGA